MLGKYAEGNESYEGDKCQGVYSLKLKEKKKELYGYEKGNGIQKIYGRYHNQQRKSVEFSIGMSSKIDENNESGKEYGQDSGKIYQQFI